jgi:formate dehydrogenase iron-sulfur subunit
MAEKAMLIDTSKCIACRGCQVACKQWNELPAETTEFFVLNSFYENPSELSANTFCLIKFHRSQTDSGELERLFRKHQCMHCTDAECLSRCPYDAAQRDAETGFIYIDQEKCRACGMCVSYCPFHVPKLTSSEKATSKKCFACLYPFNKLAAGENPQPACTKACPTGALIYGDRSAMVTKAQTRKAALESKGKKAYLYGVEEMGGLHQIYVLLREPSHYGLIEGIQQDSSRRTYLKYVQDLAKVYQEKGLPY